jgi:hypothetical protein
MKFDWRIISVVIVLLVIVITFRTQTEKLEGDPDAEEMPEEMTEEMTEEIPVSDIGFLGVSGNIRFMEPDSKKEPIVHTDIS